MMTIPKILVKEKILSLIKIKSYTYEVSPKLTPLMRLSTLKNKRLLILLITIIGWYNQLVQ